MKSIKLNTIIGLLALTTAITTTMAGEGFDESQGISERTLGVTASDLSSGQDKPNVYSYEDYEKYKSLAIGANDDNKDLRKRWDAAVPQFYKFMLVKYYNDGCLDAQTFLSKPRMDEQIVWQFCTHAIFYNDKLAAEVYAYGVNKITNNDMKVWMAEPRNHGW